MEDFAEGVDYLDVSFFVMPANVVGFTYFALCYNFIQRSGVVFYVEPIPDLVAFAVNRQWFAFQCVQDD